MQVVDNNKQTLSNYCMTYCARVRRTKYKGSDVVEMQINGSVETAIYLDKFTKRLCGMLGQPKDDMTRLLVPCNSVHTFGMKEPIDVAFISSNGVVLEVFHAVLPAKVLSNKEASYVAERFACNRTWMEQDDHVVIGPCIIENQID